MIPFLQSNTAFLAETNAVATAFTTPPSAARKTLINNTVGALISAGIWQLCDLIYFLAAADSQAATINWKTPASNVLALNNSPTFNADRGFTGDGISMTLTAAYTNSLYTQNSCHISSFGLNTSANGTSSDFSITNVTPAVRGQIKLRNATVAGIAAGAATFTVPTTGITLPGMIAGDRSDSANQNVYTNGVADGTASVASLATVATTITFLANGIGGFADRQVAFGCCGASLTAAQHLSLYRITLAYMQSVGAA